MDGYKLFRSDRQGRRGSGAALYVKDCFDCIEVDDCDHKVECLWVKMRGKANKTDILLGVCYRPFVLVSAAAGNKSTTRPPLPPPACGGE